MHSDRFFSSEPKIRNIARELYQAASSLPILSPHGHVDPSLFSDPNATFGNPVDLFITPDHYVIRTLYTNGIGLEDLGIAPKNQIVNVDVRKVWKLFCTNFHLFRATPSGLWVNTSLHEVFGIQQKLTDETADKVYDTLMDKLHSAEFSPRALFEKFNIELLATTDSAADSLEYHQAIRSSGWSGNIIPTFRFDPIVHLNNPSWRSQIDELARLSKIDINNFDTYIQALQTRREFFRTMGAIASDFSALSATVKVCSPKQINEIFYRALKGQSTKIDAERFIAHMLMEMARMSTEDGMVMQFHVGIYRNHNQPQYQQFGADIGADIPVKVEFTHNLHPLLTRFGNHPNFKLILFTLDESTYTRELAPLAGHYPALKLGPPWWFNDSLNGITRYLDQVIESAGFYKTSGFNDDTRGFCSIPARHDLWRRLSANWLAGLLSRYIIDEPDAHQMMFDLTIGLARRAYRINESEKKE
jgi:glucuronate isomerase